MYWLAKDSAKKGTPMNTDYKIFSRKYIEKFGKDERRRRLSRLETVLSDRLQPYNREKYWEEIAKIIEDLRRVGHDLCHQRSDGNRAELWGWDYMRMETASYLQIQFVFQGSVKTFWRTEGYLFAPIYDENGNYPEREILLAAARQNGKAILRSASDEVRADREIVLAAVRQSCWALEYASKDLRADREIVLAAVQQSGRALEYASKDLRADREIVLAALQQSGWFRYASKDLRADRNIVLAAVQQHSRLLRYASEKLRADREIVLAAVQQDGSAFRYASNDLRSDWDFVLAAIRQNGSAFRYVSKDLRADWEFVLAAVQQDG